MNCRNRASYDDVRADGVFGRLPSQSTLYRYKNQVHQKPGNLVISDPLVSSWRSMQQRLKIMIVTPGSSLIKTLVVPSCKKQITLEMSITLYNRMHCANLLYYIVFTAQSVSIRLVGFHLGAGQVTIVLCAAMSWKLPNFFFWGCFLVKISCSNKDVTFKFRVAL